jgi:energy-coupling factor transporter ATP-binding protein EcfA2
MHQSQHFVRVDFERFKAFNKFTLHLRQFNVLVGPNNSGKSTILAAFRMLAAAMRKATSRKAEVVTGPHGDTRGYYVDLSALSVAEENIYYNYDDSHDASVRFHLSNGNSLLLYFPSGVGRCNLITDSPKRCDTPSTFRSQFNCPIGFVPILGPVEQHEQLYEKEAARLALFSYQAARNFRNISYHYPEAFDEFRATLVRTWPGMDIQPPEVDRSHRKPRLHMFCPEERIPREICWAGFGFQVWCQMLTHLIQSRDKVLFLIDEPDIYLHSESQRQLLGLLRNLGPDILIATHSTEIVTEAEPDEIVLINKSRKGARRLTNPADLFEVFHLLGSNLNPILTQLARTKRAVFLEGKDFQILGKFAHKLKNAKLD